MSTFGGVMIEFPQIRVDYFRQITGQHNPLAGFLSHVHSDHLTGLEILKAPFIYCSATTKQLLLKLERRFHHVNYDLGILESHMQRYKHLKNLLKPIPLLTPTTIELAPGNEIQVTLFDANHCPGAVMFLFENDNHAVLYTGDVRAEPWFVNSLSRNPFLIEYTTNLRTLDCIYLDTSFTDQDLKFPTKAQGLNELLSKVAQYPPDTTFHFSAWTFGYEEVWMALSRTLKSRIHVDKYKLRLFQSLGSDSPEGPTLAGYQFGNTKQAGTLTQDENVRLHSCEKGTKCRGTGNKTVWIRPIITRTASGQEINEMGIGGGGGDLTERPELQVGSIVALQQLMELLSNADDSLLVEVKDLLRAALKTSQKTLALDPLNDQDDEDLTLENLASLLKQKVTKNNGPQTALPTPAGPHLPKVITFPYSRHSSYDELCDLIKTFKPRDIYPCTVEESKWSNGTVMALFGVHCSSQTFRHDMEMRAQNMDNNHEPSSPMTNDTSSSRASPEPTQDLEIFHLVSDEDSTNSASGRCNGPTAENELQTSTPSLCAPAQSSSLMSLLSCQAGSDSQGVFYDDTAAKSSLSIVRGDMSYLGIPSLVLSSDNNGQLRAHSKDSEELELDRRRGACSDTSMVLSSAAGASPSDHRGFSFSPTHIENSFEITKESAGPQEDTALSSSRRSQADSAELADSPSQSHGLHFSFWDPDDNIFRCTKCGWEFLRELGECSHPDCDAVEPAQAMAFVRNVDSIDGMDMDWQFCRAPSGEFLDERAAYESDRSTDNDNYEQSFLDDASCQSDEEEGSDSSKSDDEDYRELYRDLLTRHKHLEVAYDDLDFEFYEFRHDMLGSEYESDGIGEGRVDYSFPSSDEALMDYGDREPPYDEGIPIAIVDVETQDPALMEIIAQGDSQASALAQGRLEHRLAGYEAALDTTGQGWNVSLVSVNDNHTMLEMEL